MCTERERERAVALSIETLGESSVSDVLQRQRRRLKVNSLLEIDGVLYERIDGRKYRKFYSFYVYQPELFPDLVL